MACSQVLTVLFQLEVEPGSWKAVVQADHAAAGGADGSVVPFQSISMAAKFRWHPDRPGTAVQTTAVGVTVTVTATVTYPFPPRPAPLAPWTRARSFPAWAEPEGSCSLEQAE